MEACEGQSSFEGNAEECFFDETRKDTNMFYLWNAAAKNGLHFPFPWHLRCLVMYTGNAMEICPRYTSQESEDQIS